MQDATKAWSCLTGLKLVGVVGTRSQDGEFLRRVQEAWGQVARSVIVAFETGVSALAMRQWERQLHESLREVGRLIVEFVVNRIEPESTRELPPEVRFDGEFYRRKNQKSPLRNLSARLAASV